MARDVDIGTPTLVDNTTLNTKLDAIQTETDDLADGERLDLLIDAIKAKTDLIT